jgi:D-amino-acid dehydrogenase
MDSSKPRTTVIGAGVVGLATALYLQRAGHLVTVVDPMPPAGGTSYGNSGLISKDTAVPIALPGMLQKVPKWLTDREGPLCVRPEYFATALPWLLKWIKASRMPEVLRISDAMRALHKDALDCWLELLGAERFADLIRPVGQVRVWEGEGIGSKIEADICARHGVETRTLDAGALRDLYPEIAPDIRHGLMLPNNAYTISPQRLVRTLGMLVTEAGGELVNERVLKIIPRDPSGESGYRLMNNIGNRMAERVVLATGAWTNELLEPLGFRLALETERGYHAMLPNPSITIKVPMSIKNRGFGLTSMEMGMRASGTVEIGGLAAPPDELRAEILVRHVKRVFPTLEHGEPAYWMGHRPSSPDSLPFLGEAPGRRGLWIATGHGHFGMTGGTPSARLLMRMITGQPTGIDPKPYAPNRY